MKLGSSCLPLLAAGLLLGVLHGPAFGQGADGGLDSATLLKPSADSWPTYHGTYSGQHHSRLAQITPANVYRVTLAWAFETGQTAQIKPRRSSSTAFCTQRRRITSGPSTPGQLMSCGTIPTHPTRAFTSVTGELPSTGTLFISRRQTRT